MGVGLSSGGGVIGDMGVGLVASVDDIFEGAYARKLALYALALGLSCDICMCVFVCVCVCVHTYMCIHTNV